MAYDYQRRNWDGHRSIKNRFRLRDFADRHTDLLAELREYVTGLRDASTAYVDIRNPTRTDAFAEMPEGERAAIKRASERLLRTRAVAVFIPLLMAARMRYPGYPAPYLRTVELSERYAFRVYRLLGRRADAGEAALVRVAWQLHRDEIDIDAALDEVRATLLTYSPRQRFQEAFGVDASWYRWTGLKYLLYEYEQHLVGPDPVDIPWEVIDRADRERTVEHILPQTPRSDYWRQRFTDEERERYTHDLGNLVLTADNSSYGNKPFPDKKGAAGQTTPGYANANLRSERELARWDDWTPAAILERRERIVTWALRRWAVDDAPAAEAVDMPLALDDEDD
jgi:hypothetical protein